MKVTLLLAIATASIATSYAQNNTPAGRRGLQLGFGAASVNNTKFGSEPGYGAIIEAGFLSDNTPIDMVFGLRGAYIDGVGTGDLDVDILDISLMGRVLMPVGNDAIKIYGEGRLGFGNMAVNGDSRARARIGGRDFSVQSDISKDAWTVGWGLGVGIQLDFTPTFGIRIGYDLQSYGDFETLGFAMDPGFSHGASAAVLFKF